MCVRCLHTVQGATPLLFHTCVLLLPRTHRCAPQVNARGTTWDLCLDRPYRNGGYENSSRVFGRAGCDMPRARAATWVSTGAASRIDPAIAGAPGRRWTAELALPVADLLLNNSRGAPRARAGALWRVNFSRVEWRVRAAGGHYEKLPLPEDNWVWQERRPSPARRASVWSVELFEK